MKKHFTLEHTPRKPATYTSFFNRPSASLTRLLLCILCLLLSYAPLKAQDSLRVLSYNLLNFPDANPAGKADTLRKIIDFIEPDLFLVCELKTAAGAEDILNESLNDGPFVQYRMADFTSNQSNPGGSNNLQQMLYYDQNKLTLYSQRVYKTSVRDINEYVLYVKDPFLAGHRDTTFLDVYVVHLKASNTSSDAAIRANMVDTLHKYISLKGPNRQVILGGDFNVYSSTEEAYETLIDPFNTVWLRDPINTPGSWSGTFTFAPVHTQSTRTSSIFGDGSGGGLDDRFDFIMLSTNFLNSSGRATYVSGSYQAIGNDGSCFNGSITSCGATTPAIRNSLFYMSDHLPIVLDLAIELPQISGVGNEEVAATLSFPYGNICSGQLTAVLEQLNGPIEWQVFDYNGRQLSQGKAIASVNKHVLTLDTEQLSNGLHLLYIRDNTGAATSASFLVN